MPENNTPQPKTRQQRIEEFLLNPQKATFESLEQFESAVQELLDIFSAINIEALEKLEGEDGETPVRGVDYMNEEDFKALEEFILSKIPTVGKELPSRLQVENFIKEQVAKIPRIKGDDGKSLKFSDLTESQKEELRGKDGASDTGLQILAKLRALPKNQRLGITDVRGLENVIKGIIDSVDQIDEEIKEVNKNIKVVIPANPSGGGNVIESALFPPIEAPVLVGQMYIDTDAGNIYISVGTDTLADWRLLTTTVPPSFDNAITEQGDNRIFENGMNKIRE